MIDWKSLSSRFSLSEAQVAELRRLLDILASDRSAGLTSVRDREGIFNRHLLDSLSLLAFSEVANTQSIADVGSGAGLPGLPLAIALPNACFVLIESNHRKCDFIEETAALVGLDNTAVACTRAEEAGRSSFRESFDVALARAVAPLPVVLEYTLPLVSVGGFALLSRGARRDGDSAAAASVAGLLGGSLVRIHPVSPYPGARNLHAWLFRKDAPTPDRFPRRPGIPAKRPLGS